MAIRVNTNVSSLISQNALSKNTKSLENTMKQLSTGLRVNNAKDDAAGLAISEALKAQIRGNDQAIKNIENAVNVIAIAEGGMQSATDDLLRIRELCVQAASDIYESDKKQAIMNEIKQRIENIDVTSETTTFAGKTMLNGSVSSLVIQTGANSLSATNTVDIGPVMTNLHISAGGLDIKLDITSLGNGVSSGGALDGATWTGDMIRKYLDKLDAAIDKIASDRSMLGAYTNRLESTSANMTTMNENFEATKSSIIDVDVAKASSDMIKYQILQQTSSNSLIQSNNLPQIAISLLGS
ncbi:MAG: hypothetical protein BHW64_05335 [Candidatus Melainabacteria bacterium LEY3_CP_29_8]|nr:MAG: hypothetical protein BHW64_05335 [Candidatus Melainabacteria bacterium LEY3_CP_29_8]